VQTCFASKQVAARGLEH